MLRVILRTEEPKRNLVKFVARFNQLAITRRYGRAVILKW